MSITVVKLGGSFAHDPRLRGWLDALAQADEALALVPGGGPFADAVRAAQPRLGFDAAAAHDMALMAMAQFGRALCALNPRFALAETREEMAATIARGVIPVWAPLRMASAALPPSWDVTSDSLAAWLAGALGASSVILVKHGKFSERGEEAEALVAAGVIDPLFARYARASAARAFLAQEDDAASFGERLRARAFPEILLRGESERRGPA